MYRGDFGDFPSGRQIWMTQKEGVRNIGLECILALHTSPRGVGFLRTVTDAEESPSNQVEMPGGMSPVRSFVFSKGSFPSC